MLNADPYSDKAERYFAALRHEMLCYLPPNIKDVLEVGCGVGAFAAEVKKKSDVRVTAIEPFESAAATAATRLDEVLHASAEVGLQRLEGRDFDCMIFNDVIEHLVDPESVLSAAVKLLRPNGVLVASIPNMRYLPVLRALVLHGEWRYTNDGVLDRTHLRFFKFKSIAEMFVACGYRIHTLEGINPRPVSWKFRLLNRITSNAIDDMRFQQFAVVASRADAASTRHLERSDTPQMNRSS